MQVGWFGACVYSLVITMVGLCFEFGGILALVGCLLLALEYLGCVLMVVSGCAGWLRGWLGFGL